MFGNLFNPNVPSGNPLDPRLAGAPQGALAAPQAPPVPQPALQAPAAPQGALSPPQLPKPPASIQRKKINPWDKQHIALALLDLSKGMASGGTFLEGLGAAGRGMAGRMYDEQKAELGSTEVGGPDNAFEIHTDADGNRTYTPIAAVTDYLDGKKKRENAPKPKETAELVGDSLYAVEQLPPEQRPGAYQLLIDQAKAAGHDVSWAPPEYSPTFSKAMIARTIGARQGSANAATAAQRAEMNADRDAAREASIRFREAADARARAAAGRSAESHARSMRAAPPSKRRGTSDLDYLK